MSTIQYHKRIVEALGTWWLPYGFITTDTYIIKLVGIEGFRALKADGTLTKFPKKGISKCPRQQYLYYRNELNELKEKEC